jgi:hypothetical protein
MEKEAAEMRGLAMAVLHILGAVIVPALTLPNGREWRAIWSRYSPD